MSSHRRWTRAVASLGLPLWLLASCDRSTTAPRDGAPAAPEIRDGAHLGNQHFFFLPPVLPMPVHSGVSDGSLAPVVSICAWNPLANACGTLVAEFATSGSGTPRVTYDVMGEKYEVSWKTDQCLTGPCSLDPAITYRIRVLIGAVELGHADVDVVMNGSQLKNVQTSEYIGLVDGRTLPIKFRIEAGAVAVLTPGGSAPIGQSGGLVTTSDGSVALAFPEGAVGGNTTISVATVAEAPAGAGAWAPVVNLGPDGTTFANPVTLAIQYHPENLPDGVPPSALVLMTFDGTGWVQVPGSTIDSVDNTVSAPISHFSWYSVGIWPNRVGGVLQNTIRVGQTTTVNGGVWYYFSGQFTQCSWERIDGITRLACRTYYDSHTYPVQNIAVYWGSSAPAIASVAPAPTYTNAYGIAESPPVTGLLPGNTDLRASSAGTTSDRMPLTVLGVLGLLPRTATNVAGWSVGERITQSVAIPTDLSVSLLNRNGFLVVGESGTGSYTYGGQTGTYVLPAGSTSKTLTVAGLNGVGTDTLIASAAGFVPDTAVISLVKGKFLITGWPTALAFGDSAALTLTVADQDGRFGSLASPIDVSLTPGPGLVFTNGTAAITTLRVQQRTSATFYVKATGSGSRTITVSHRDYLDCIDTLTVSAPPTIGFTPSSVTIPVQQGAANTTQIQITNVGGGTLSGLAAGSFSNYFNGSPEPWVTASLSSTTAPATVTIRAAPGLSLPAGAYQLRFDLSAPGATNSPVTFYSINVTVIVAGVPPVNATIVPNPTSLAFSVPQGESASRQISITNGGPDPLTHLTVGTFSNYFNGSPAPWVTATISPTTAPATITITAAPDLTTPTGTQQLRFGVNSPGATNSPYTFYSINVTVEPSTVPLFTLTDLGTLGGAGTSEALAINGSGRIVGVSNQRGFYMDATAPAPSQVPNPFGDIWWAYDVNASGVIAATQPYTGYTWDPGTNTLVGPPPGPFTQNNRKMVFALNNTGLVLACADNGAYAQNYVWTVSSNSATLIPNAYNYCYGKINDAGIAIANADPGAGGSSSLWNQASQAVTPIPSLGGVTIGRDLNAASIAVGSSQVGAFRHAFRFDPATGQTRDLGTLGGNESEAEGINDTGVIVGWSLNAAGQKRGFIWDPNRQRMFELAPLAGHDEAQANDINQNGVIVGYSAVGGVHRAVRWTPQ